MFIPLLFLLAHAKWLTLFIRHAGFPANLADPILIGRRGTAAGTFLTCRFFPVPRALFSHEPLPSQSTVTACPRGIPSCTMRAASHGGTAGLVTRPQQGRRALRRPCCGGESSVDSLSLDRVRLCFVLSEGGFASVGYLDPLRVRRGIGAVVVVPVPPLVRRGLGV